MIARRTHFQSLRLTLALALSSVAGVSGAACMGAGDPRFAEFERLMLMQPAAAAEHVQSRLRSTDPADPELRARLYVALADAYAALEMHAETQRAVAAGFALVDQPASDAYLDLVYLDTLSPKTEGEIRSSRQRAERLLKRQGEGSRAQVCVLFALGMLEHYADRPDQASIHLTRAYRLSELADREQVRIPVASVLSMVLRALGDEPGALKLNQEVIDSHQRRGAEFDLATAYFLRGFILTELRDHAPALDVLERSRALSVKLNDAIGAAYSDILICTNELGLGRLPEARERCARSVALFEKAGSQDPVNQALLVLAEIDLAERQPGAALHKLDRVLSEDGRTLPPFRIAQAYQLRSRAHRELKNFESALADAEHYLQRFKASKEDERAREAAAIRARFETDREIERNEFLQRELRVRNERLEAQEERMRWMVAASVAGLVGILLLALLLIANRKKKRLLARLATEDELTGLPNRRHALKRAELAFASIRELGAPLTIAILDLDLFKRINDEFGHAAGDFVLREFARVARQNVRQSDLLGRWGGEEFLLVMPNTKLDVAHAAVDRVRQAVGEIQGGPLPADYRITVSAGLANDDGRATSLEYLIAEADGALYEAKHGGRNRVQVAQRSFDTSPTHIRRSLRTAGIDLQTGTHAIPR